MRLSTQSKTSKKLPLRQLIVFALLGAIMFISKIVMEGLPNVHLLGMLTMTYTLVYRRKALIPIYIYVLLNGLFAGFNAWWLPYLYIWTILWAFTMILPKKMPKWLACIVLPLICGLHGLAYGTLYAPAQAIMYGFSLEQTLAWIVSGLPFDAIHGVSNLVVGLLIYPLSQLLQKLEAKK